MPVESTDGIGQVNDAITQMDQVTQQNAALVEESAAAAASLREQADRLAHAVAVFKLSGQEARQAIAQAQASAQVAPRPVAKAAAGSASKPAVRAAARPAAKPVTPAAVKPTAKAGDDWEEF